MVGKNYCFFFCILIRDLNHFSEAIFVSVSVRKKIEPMRVKDLLKSLSGKLLISKFLVYNSVTIYTK